MSDLGNRANVNSAIDLLLDDTQPNEAIQPSDHNTLLKNILDTLANGLSVTLRTGNTTSGQNVEITAGDSIDFGNSGFLGSLVPNTLTANRQYDLPDATGTIALLSDITGGNTIYTADDTVGASRVATLTDTLRFKSGIVEVQGIGTTGSSLLSLYDGQGTPVKLWDFLDNGNVNLGVNSVVNQDSNVLEFSNISGIGGLKFTGTSNNGVGLNLANSTNKFDLVVAGSLNTNIGNGSLGLLTGNTWKVQITQTGKVSIGSNFEPISGYDLSVEGSIRTNGQLRAITSLVGNNATAIAGYDLVVDNKASFGNEFAIVSPAGTMQFNGYRSQNTVPNTATFPNDKDLGIHKNTSTGVISLAYNNGGTIVSVQLT